MNQINTADRKSFSGTDESVLLRFAKVSERMWVALFLVPLRVCSLRVKVP